MQSINRDNRSHNDVHPKNLFNFIRSAEITNFHNGYSPQSAETRNSPSGNSTLLIIIVLMKTVFLLLTGHGPEGLIVLR